MFLREQICALSLISSYPHLPLSNKVNPLCGSYINLHVCLTLLPFWGIFALIHAALPPEKAK